MAIIRTLDSIILTGETAKSFSQKMKYPDREAMRKRNKFLKECKDSIEIIKGENGNVTLKSKEE